MRKKSIGILLPIASLPNQFPIGDLGPCAYKFVDFLHNSGQEWWQVLPINPTGKDNSPYRTFSAFAGNPLLISPEQLVRHGFLKKNNITLSISNNSDKINYQNAKKLKSRLLKKAFNNFTKENNSEFKSKFEKFVRTESYWLEDFALYCAIQKKEKTFDWTRWKKSLRLRDPEALSHAKITLEKEIRYHQFVQWQFALQWHALRMYCIKKSIHLIGDIPLFVAHHSADVWAHSNIFKLDTHDKPIVIAGVPPDYFSKTGQLWNVPVYNWDTLKKQNYSWWIRRLAHVAKHFDILRLDHFIGFVRSYEIPVNAKTAQNGQYHSGGGLPFFETVQKSLKKLPFIADDLGEITTAVKTLRNQLNIPGTKVVQFEFDLKISENNFPQHLIHKNKFFSKNQNLKNFVLYTSTHDNDTTQGWYKSFSLKQRKILCEHFRTNAREFSWAMIQEALASNADMVIIPMQDILGLGSDARINLPGTTKGNWKWRLKQIALTPMLEKKLKNSFGS